MSFHRMIMFLIFLTAQSMVFGLGTAVVVITPSLIEHGNVWLPVVNISSVVIAAVAAWLITPVVRARYAAKRRVAALADVVLAEAPPPDRAAGRWRARPWAAGRIGATHPPAGPALSPSAPLAPPVASGAECARASG